MTAAPEPSAARAETPRLSLIVIAKNEERRIGRCLASIPFAFEKIVVDSGSTDRTVALARAAGAHVVQTPDWPGYGAQKNRALAAAAGEWILSLDADEWANEALAAAIAGAIEKPAADGYEFPRRNRFCGQVVRHSGWSPDYVLRLFRRGKGRFSDDLVHEHVLLDGRKGRLTPALDHDTIEHPDELNVKADRYAEAAAQDLAQRGARSSLAKARLRGAARYLRTLLVQGGILDGAAGLAIARYNARYTYRKWRRAAELTAARQETKPGSLTRP
jgi:glycosyltransferase involved in cell wall biosynthesis